MRISQRLSTTLVLRVLMVALFLGVASACGTSAPIAAPPPSTAPFFRTPPAALGDGLVCAAAADRLLGIQDGFDLRQFTRGTHRPQNATIQQALGQYLAARSTADRQQAAGLIQGQCEAYGFYPVTYQECVRASKGAMNDVVRGCIARRTWTVYTQQ